MHKETSFNLGVINIISLSSSQSVLMERQDDSIFFQEHAVKQVSTGFCRSVGGRDRLDTGFSGLSTRHLKRHQQEWGSHVQTKHDEGPRGKIEHRQSKGHGTIREAPEIHHLACQEQTNHSQQHLRIRK